MAPDSRKRRRRWERRWQQRQGAEFCWYLDEAPKELVDLVADGTAPPGAALDLGCGPGVATTFLARSFRPTVGLDIAHGAVAEARSYARDRGTDPSFVVAEAPLLPFRSGSFSLIFDRGCLQAIPRGAWPRYFEEIRRLLGPKAVFELFCSKPLKRFPPMLSYRGIRARARWLLGRRGPQFLSHSLLIDMAGPSLEVLSLDDFSYRPATGPPRLMTHGVFRKS